MLGPSLRTASHSWPSVVANPFKVGTTSPRTSRVMPTEKIPSEMPDSRSGLVPDRSAKRRRPPGCWLTVANSIPRRFPSGCNHSLDGRKVPALERCGGVGHVPRGHARNRRVEVIKRLARQRGSDLGTKARAQWRFMHHDAAAGLGDGADNCLDVEWNQGSQVDDCRRDPFARQPLRSQQAGFDCSAPGYEGDVISFAY